MTEILNQKPFAFSEAYEINGTHTEIILHKFVNKYFLIVTQYEKLNNVFSAAKDFSVSGDVRDQSFEIKHNFGMTSDDIECGIRFLLTNIQSPHFRFDSNMNVSVCLGLKEYNSKFLKQIISVINRLGQPE